MSRKHLMAVIDRRLDDILPNSDGVRVASVGKLSLEIALEVGPVASKDGIAESIRSRCDAKGIVPND